MSDLREFTATPTVEELEAEIERLTNLLKLEREYSDSLLEKGAELEARVEALEGAIRWALGESPEGMPDFPLIGEPPYYRWRTQLRLFADLPYIAATKQGEQKHYIGIDLAAPDSDTTAFMCRHCRAVVYSQSDAEKHKCAATEQGESDDRP